MEKTIRISKDLPSRKLTCQWKMDLLKMYSLLKMGIFRCHVSLLEGRFLLAPGPKKNKSCGNRPVDRRSLTLRMVTSLCEMYPSSHNHGSVENGCISNISVLSCRVIFHFHGKASRLAVSHWLSEV